jgi:peptidoglycan/xylan/chitin deacetylase (PgdA/CDA1 family)
METTPLSGRRPRRFVRALILSALTAGSAQWLAPLSARMNRPGILYWQGDGPERKIALTFDDGPNEPYTSQILEILRREGVHATFFLVGKNVEAFPEAARAIVSGGHAIGNHTYSHANLVFDTNARVRREILKAEEVIERVTGFRTTLFRAPYGDKNFFTIHQAKRLGYQMIQWSVSAQDWRKPGPRRIVRRVLRGARPGAIVLMHDGDKGRHGGDRSQTVAALPSLISELRGQGYSFVTLPELLNLPAPSEIARRASGAEPRG